MNNKKEIKDELEKLSPFLSEIKKENAFEVPENYFKSLPDKVLEQIQVSKNTTKQSEDQAGWIDRLIENIVLLFQPKYAVGFATALVFVVASVYIFRKPTDQIDGSYQLASQYISDHIDEFDVEMIWELSVSETGESTADEGIDDSSFDEYLDEIIDELDDSELEKLL
jgi:hypothetical protein